MLIIWLLYLQFSVTVGHSPSLGRSVFLEAQQRRDMFANKADTVSLRLLASQKGRREVTTCFVPDRALPGLWVIDRVYVYSDGALMHF